MNYLIGGEVPKRTGNWHPNLVPYQPFATSDGEIIIAVGNDRQFGIFCKVLGLPEIAKNPKYLTNSDRIENREALISTLAKQVILQSNHYWLTHLPDSGVPCSVINDIEQVFDEPQIKARKMKIELPHPVAGLVPGVANPLNFSKSTIEYNKAPPLHGADTDAVLNKILGMSEHQLKDLKAQNVI
jgi:crotonobetainyl-CoA:carnitine CoA-transferase CaiB-like acyl-CoA transferase